MLPPATHICDRVFLQLNNLFKNTGLFKRSDLFQPVNRDVIAGTTETYTTTATDQLEVLAEGQGWNAPR